MFCILINLLSTLYFSGLVVLYSGLHKVSGSITRSGNRKNYSFSDKNNVSRDWKTARLVITCYLSHYSTLYLGLIVGALTMPLHTSLGIQACRYFFYKYISVQQNCAKVQQSTAKMYSLFRFSFSNYYTARVN